jgi:radical SAM family uncharacterized protein
MKIQYIDPIEKLGALLLGVEKPARYVGGEYGSIAKRPLHDAPPGAPHPADRRETVLRTLIAFPDLYEIGMSNQAFRIIYNKLNKIPGIICDRAFAPAPDFEALLRDQGLPLYGLDTGISLKETDVLMFTLGYELGITGVLAMLDLASIPLFAAERGGEHPIVIMGGPCVSNPLPYSAFIDAFWIGEAEAGFFDLAEELLDLKRKGAGRTELFARISRHPSIWVRGKARAVRAIDANFAARPPEAAVFPVPSMKTVQHHGSVEIMRGCPNGCRFCHAGFWYRPMRQKPLDTVIGEAGTFINQGGYREISLSSLSTGDYSHIDALVDCLNRAYSRRHISFQLPSLKVSSFSLPLLEKISETRKSGLTFAVETPETAWQLAINKTVTQEQILAILREAKQRGWRGAKFYFMVGLPVGNYQKEQPEEGENPAENSEELKIVDFIAGLGRIAGMHFSINAGIFVPKPHTPFERVPQAGMNKARRQLEYIRSRLKPLGHKVSVQDPLISTIEGILSRGDERAGDLIKRAFDQGCRLDAWSEYLKKDVWEELLTSHEALVHEILAEKPQDVPLPWTGIESGVSGTYIKREFTRSRDEDFTSLCIQKCTDRCGICDHDVQVVKNIIQDDKLLHEKMPIIPSELSELPDEPSKNPLSPASQSKSGRDLSIWRLVFSFSKTGKAVFLPHLSLVETFSMSLIRAGIPVLYSKGFNPLPRLEICAPLSIGISSEEEIALIETAGELDPAGFISAVNQKLPEGILIRRAENYYIPAGGKKHSLSSLLWGFAYAGNEGTTDYIKAGEEKKYRQSRMAETDANTINPASVFGLQRLTVLAKDPEDPEQSQGFFEAYRKFYPLTTA